MKAISIASGTKISSLIFPRSLAQDAFLNPYPNSSEYQIDEIKGYVGTAAQTIAGEYGIPFNAQEEEQNYVTYLINDGGYLTCSPTVVYATIPDMSSDNTYGYPTMFPSFEGCNALKSITFLDCAVSIPERIIEECPALEEIRGYKGSTAESFAKTHGIEFHPLPENSSYGPLLYYRSRLESCDFSVLNAEIADSINDIPITEISQNAFRRCTALQTVSIPASVITIPDGTFDDCINLKAIYGYTGTAAETYAKKYNINFIGRSTEPRYVQVDSIGRDSAAYAIYGCDKQAITFHVPEQINDKPIKAIGWWQCNSLKELTLPEGLTSIYSLRGCPSLTELKLPNSLRFIEREAFSGTALTELVLPEGFGNYQGEGTYDCPPYMYLDYNEEPDMKITSEIIINSNISVLTIKNRNAVFDDAWNYSSMNLRQHRIYSDQKEEQEDQKQKA